MGLQTYTAVWGDYLYKIANDHGTTVGAIWNHPANSQHRAKRGSPDVLYPGDVLQIPVEEAPPPPPSTVPEPPPPKPLDPFWPYPELPVLAPPKMGPSWECPMGICQCVVVDTEPLSHRIVLFDDRARRMPNARARVLLGRRVLNEAQPYADGNGEVAVELPPHAKWLEVQWAPHSCPQERPYPYRRHYFVHMGDTEAEGVARRLRNLGFTAFPNLEANVQDLQRAFGIPPAVTTKDIESVLFHFHDQAGLTPPPQIDEPPRHHLGLGVPDAWPPSELPAAAPPPQQLMDASHLPTGQEGDKHDNGALFLGSAAPVLGASGTVQPFDPFLRATPPVYTTSSELAALFSDYGKRFPHAPLSIVELGGITRPYFGFRDTDVCFSASTCKLTALMTAFMLLNSLRWFAWALFWDGVPVERSQFLNEAAARFRQPILDVASAHPELAKSVNGGLEDQILPVLSGRSGHPTLRNMEPAFEVHAPASKPDSWAANMPWIEGPYEVKFSLQMGAHIAMMMGQSDNESSAYVIRTCGQGYIHGALKHAGLFENDKGLWLTGDFSDLRGPRDGKYQRRDIPCVNDGPTAQGATSLAFLQAVDMALAGVFGERGHLRSEMVRSRYLNPSWLGRAHGFEAFGFDDVMGKLGDSFAIAGKVYSEVMVARHRESGRQFAICFQNATGFEAAEGPLTNFIFPRLLQFIEATKVVF